MSHWTFTLETSALTLAVLWLLMGLNRRPRSGLAGVWLVFCASMALFMVKRIGGADLGDWQFLIGLGACFTCNVFWLVARGLFRPGQSIGLAPVLFALGIASLLMVRQLLQLGVAWSWWSADSGQRVGAALADLSGLLCSTTLALAFWEGVRGWTGTSLTERRIRIVYLCTYGGCVLVSGSLSKLCAPEQLVAVEGLLEAGSAFSVLLVTQALVWWRLRHPLAESCEQASLAPPALTSAPSTAIATQAPPQTTAPAVRTEERELATRLDRLVRERQLYLEPELKLVHLAQALEVSEYRISRAITGALGERNINRYLNRWRLKHARQLLQDRCHADRSILDIALASGFASLGPFNRAFKESTGLTPGAFRSGGGSDTDSAPIDVCPASSSVSSG